MEDLKITKAKEYRVNFRYKGKHYSIQDCGELYEEYTCLSCKEDREFYFILEIGARTNSYLPLMRYGQTYKNMDLSKIKKIITKYIDK